MSSTGRFRLVLYACALVLAIVCSPFLFFLSYSFPLETLEFFGINLTFGLAIVSSCAYHGIQQSEKAMILPNIGRTFFSGLFASRFLMTVLFTVSSIGVDG
jgi:hypothetical protein